MIDPRDLGKTLGDRSDPHSPPGKRGGAPGFDPTLFLYDHVPGGIGLAPRLFEAREELLRRARGARARLRLRGGLPGVHRPRGGPGGDAPR